MSRSNVKKWLQYWPIFAVLGIIVYALIDAEQERIEAEIQREYVPEYLYMDRHGVYHKSLDCFYLNPVKSEYWYQMGNLSMDGQIPYGVQRVLFADLTPSTYIFKYMCSCCISDQDYKKYKEIAEENYNKKRDYSQYKE